MSNESGVFRTLDLPGGTLVPFPSMPGERVRVMYGRVWLTEEGNARDAILASGEEVSLHSRGLAVVEALGPARIEWIEPARGSLKTRLENGVARVLAWFRRRQPVECRIS